MRWPRETFPPAARPSVTPVSSCPPFPMGFKRPFQSYVRTRGVSSLSPGPMPASAHLPGSTTPLMAARPKKSTCTESGLALARAGNARVGSRAGFWLDYRASKLGNGFVPVVVVGRPLSFGSRHHVRRYMNLTYAYCAARVLDHWVGSKAHHHRALQQPRPESIRDALASVAVLWGHGSREELQAVAPDALLRHPHELLPFAHAD